MDTSTEYVRKTGEQDVTIGNCSSDMADSVNHPEIDKTGGFDPYDTAVRWIRQPPAPSDSDR